MQRIYQLGIPFPEITDLFITHHHSDHVVGFPDLWLTGWIGRPWGKRRQPLHVWGPVGTQQMMEHLPLAFAVDIRVRSKNYPADGIKLVTHEIEEGELLHRDGIRVSAFKVDHGSEDLPAYGYRIDYQDRAAVLSGDTTFNENLIRHSQGADVLIHEVTAAAGSTVESPDQLKRIGNNHTTPEQAGEIFSRVKPKLAVYNHLLLFGGATAEDLIPATRNKYSGPLVVGEDLLQIEIGKSVEARRFGDRIDHCP